MLFDKYSKDAWQDSSLDRIIIEYNDIIVDIDTDIGIKRIILKNYIAIDYIGQWDENIIKAIYQEENNDFIKTTIEKVKACNNTKYRGGGTRDINSDWKCFIIQLIDNIEVRIVCSDILCE